MKKTILSLASTAVIAIALLFTTKPSGLIKMFTFSKQEFAINFIPANTTNELLDIKANPRANIIRTLSDFDAVVNSYNTPFSKLSPEELQTFRKQLVFRAGKGVVGMNFYGIKNKINPKDFAEIMSYFGVDVVNGYWGLSTNPKVLDNIRGGTRSLAGGDGYICVVDPNGNYCRVAPGYICMPPC